MLQFYLYKLGIFVLDHVPVSWSYGLAAFISKTQYLFSKVDKKAVKRNLSVIFQREDNLDELAREMFINFGRYFIEFFLAHKKVTKEFVSEHVRLDNVGFIDQALEKGKGVILVTAHIGNWEMGGIVLSMLGYPTNVVALPHKQKAVNDLFNSQREIKGVKVIPSNMAVRKCLVALKRNELLALVSERDFTNQGVEVKFFGKKIVVPRGAAMFSMQTGAAIVPTFLTRESGGLKNTLSRFALTCYKPMYPPSNVNESCCDSEVKKYIQEYIKVIEGEIKKDPAQWVMFREFESR